MCIKTCDSETVLHITLTWCGCGPVAMLSGYVRPWNSLCLQMDFWQFARRKRLQSVHAGLAPTWWFSVSWSICLGSSHLAVVWFSWFSIGSNSDSSLHVLSMTMEFLGGSNRRPGLGLIAASSTSLDQNRRHDGVHVVIPLLTPRDVIAS